MLLPGTILPQELNLGAYHSNSYLNPVIVSESANPLPIHPSLSQPSIHPDSLVGSEGCFLFIVDFKSTFILAVLTAVALILAPLFYLTWLHTGTSNANFYFAASLIIGIVRVGFLLVTILYEKWLLWLEATTCFHRLVRLGLG